MLKIQYKTTKIRNIYNFNLTKMDALLSIVTNMQIKMMNNKHLKCA